MKPKASGAQIEEIAEPVLSIPPAEPAHVGAMAALAPVLPFSLSTLDSRAPPRWGCPPMENAMKKLLIAAVAAPVLLGSLPKAAPAAEPGVLLAQYHDGDAQRHEEWERHREREAERAARWDSFFRARMHEHRERDGYNWVNLPMPEKERVIRDEWERWGARRWGR